MGQVMVRSKPGRAMLLVAVALLWALPAGAQTANTGGENATEMIVAPAEPAGVADVGETSVRQRWESPFDVLSRGSVSPREPRAVVVRPATPEAIAAVAEPGQVVARVRQVAGAASAGVTKPAPEAAAGSVAGGGAAPPADGEEDAEAPSAPTEDAVVSPVRRHTVTTGDTLFGLARRYGVSADAIREANRMSDDVVRLGQTLVIPGEEATR